MTLSNKTVTVLDCTLRDGGYYNNWDFPLDVIDQYLKAMQAAQVDVVELGFRFLKNDGFKGACAYTTDDFLSSLGLPSELTISVMINGSDLYSDIGWEAALEKLFPECSNCSPVDLVRIAFHFHELENVLNATDWLAERGYRVGLNLMQITERTQAEIQQVGESASASPVEVLYFADSMGSMTPADTSRIVDWFKKCWSGALGIHTHDNMHLALANALCAFNEGVSWLDATVTGMGRGPGNIRIEELAVEVEAIRDSSANIVPLMTLIRNYFEPMKKRFGWGSNPYYYLAGKYGIHPSYIQEMLIGSRFDEEDKLAVIDHLRKHGGNKFSVHTLDDALQFYNGAPRGTWKPSGLLKDCEVLILGKGPSLAMHRTVIQSYIRRRKPVVFALNTQSGIDSDLIDFRVACHPVRLLADAETYKTLPQPLITPISMLPETLQAELQSSELLDFGLTVEPGQFSFCETYCVAPCSLVSAYALAIAKSGLAKRILLAGFDGFDAGDARNDEIESVFGLFSTSDFSGDLVSITPTKYKNLRAISVYAM